VTCPVTEREDHVKHLPFLLKLSLCPVLSLCTALSLYTADTAATFADEQITVTERGTDTPADVQEGKGIPAGINDRFIDAELDVTEWIGRFEIESREVYAARADVLKACGIKPGDTVADIGAGTGFYSRMFANAVGSEGWVFAVDISPRFLEHINRQSHEDGIDNMTCVMCSSHSAGLPPNSVDVVFICDTYHHFEHPQSTLESIHRALKPGGKLIVIDFERIPGESRDFILGHVRAGKDVFRGEIVDAGFQLVDEVSVAGFKENYLLRFRKK
jgi:ubiquinone/menaquinone biosynthesis C-methylase UbiE